MGYKRIIRKVARFILTEQPNAHVTVKVESVSTGAILQGKRIVVTGGGSGIGLAMAKKFVAEGASVVISGRNENKLKNAVTALGLEKAHYIVYDVSDVDSCANYLGQCKEILGGIDCLVSNAGVSFHEGSFENVTVDDFDKQFNINYRGNYFLCKTFLEMKEKEANVEGAQLLLITSETGDICYDIPYGMTKAGLNSLVRALSRRVYKKGIRVNGIAPGVTQSDMTKDYAEASDGNLYMDNASGRIFLPEEVAEVACFLLSDASKCISGEIIHTNAGNHLKPHFTD